MSDFPDHIDRDFGGPEVTIPAQPAHVYLETVRLLDRVVDLLDRVIDEYGVK